MKDQSQKYTLKDQQNKPHLNTFGFEEEGKLYWWASWYAKILGYKSLRTLEPTISKAKDNCSHIGLHIEENFIWTERTLDGKKFKDYKLTKFACFLIAMHADIRKTAVKKAQIYFINEFEELSLIGDNQEFVQRRLAREELKELNSDLSSSAARARVRDFSFFINEGFIGMYHTTVGELKNDRGLKSKSNMYDHIGITELAANIFRIALTTERLKHIKNPSESKAAREHWKIGAQIRTMIKENTGVYPEQLKTKYDINQLEKRLKAASEQLNSIEQKSIG